MERSIDLCKTLREAPLVSAYARIYFYETRSLFKLQFLIQQKDSISRLSPVHSVMGVPREINDYTIPIYLTEHYTGICNSLYLEEFKFGLRRFP